jgi:VWFA-related protein
VRNQRIPFLRCLGVTFLSTLTVWPQQPSTPSTATQAPTTAPTSSSSALTTKQASTPETTVTVNTRLVSLDVVVTDRHGRPATDLKKEDFTILERGQPQRIAAFNLQQPKPAQTPAGAQPAPSPLPPGVYGNRQQPVAAQSAVTVVLLDALNTPMADQAYARYEMLQFLKSQHDASQSIAIFALTTRLLMLQDFTTDPNLLRKAIEKRSPNSSPLLSDPDADRLEMPGADDTMVANLDRLEQEQVNVQNDMRMRITMDAMQAIARSLGGYAGRKNLIWVSAAFPLYAAFDGDSAAFFNQTSMTDEIQHTATLLTDSQVSVYPVDARGLVGSPLASATFTGRTRGGRLMNGPQMNSEINKRSFALSSSHDAMNQIADSTGGKAYYNRNDIDHAVALSIADGSTYYTIAYYPEDKDWNGRFRKVEVKLTRGDLQARYRHGYYATDPGENIKLPRKEVVKQINAALIDPLLSTTVTFYGSAYRLVAPTQTTPSPNSNPPTPSTGTSGTENKPATAALKSDKQKIGVRFLVEPSSIAIDKRGDVQHFSIEFVIAAFKGEKIVGEHSETLEGNAKPDTYNRILKQGFLYGTTIDVPQGNCRLRLLVHDNQTGKLGTVDIPVTEKTTEVALSK